MSKSINPDVSFRKRIKIRKKNQSRLVKTFHFGKYRRANGALVRSYHGATNLITYLSRVDDTRACCTKMSGRLQSILVPYLSPRWARQITLRCVIPLKQRWQSDQKIIFNSFLSMHNTSAPLTSPNKVRFGWSSQVLHPMIKNVRWWSSSAPTARGLLSLFVFLDSRTEIRFN